VLGVPLPMNRSTLWRFIASVIRRVPSTRGVPVALRSMLGPSAEMTAFAPVTAVSIAASSVVSPTIRRRFCGQVFGTLPGLRT
jgi:hypothetical protein